MASKYEVKEGDLVNVPQNTVFYGNDPQKFGSFKGKELTLPWTWIGKVEEPVTAVVAGFDEERRRVKLYCKLEEQHDLIWCDLNVVQLLGV